MIYVLLTYLFYPILWIVTRVRRRPGNRRILVIQTAKIGDVICATPIFRALARSFPQAYVTALVNPVTRELFQGYRHVHSVIGIASDFSSGFAGKYRLIRLIQRGRYDIAISLNPNVPFAVGLCWGLVPIRLSVLPDFAGSTFRFAAGLFTHLAPHASDRLVVQTYFDVLKNIGVDSNDFTKEVIKASGADDKAATLLAGITHPLVGIAVSSANKLKQLSAMMISALIDCLTKRADLYIVLTGAGSDRDDAQKVLDLLSDTDRVINAVGMFTLGELPALLERLSVFVGVDSGLTYMADACNTPVVQIAGPVNTLEQRPMGASVIITRDLPCAPCSHVFKTVQSCRIKTRDCIESVTAREVCDAVLLLLRGRNGRVQSKNSLS